MTEHPDPMTSPESGADQPLAEAHPVSETDILIIGAGPVGMTLHLALAAGGQKSLLIDR